MNKSRFVFLGFFFFFLGNYLLLFKPLYAEFNKSQWRFSKKIILKERNAGTSSTLFRGQIDGDIYDKSQTTLQDIRILTSSGTEIPYILHSEKDVYQKIPRQVQRFNESSVPGQFETVTLKIKEARDFHDRLVILTSGVNFKRRVEVEGSLDQKEWFLIKDNGYLLDFSEEGVHYRKNEITYPQSNYPYLRLKVFDNAYEKTRPFHITDVWSYKTLSRKANRREIPHQKLEQTTDPESNESLVIIDLSYKNLPHEQVILETPDKNFHRRCLVEISNDKLNWQSVESSFIYDFSLDHYQDSQLTLLYGPNRSRFIKLRIYNGDSPPLTINNVLVYSLPADVIFQRLVSTTQDGLPKKPLDESYRLFYGNSAAQFPVYDFSYAASHMVLTQAIPVRLGPEEINSEFREKEKPLTERNPYLLWIILGAVFLILGGLILRMIKQVQRNPSV